MLVQILFLVICETVIAVSQTKPHYDVENMEAVAKHFENFIRTHSRKYIGEEKLRRFSIFLGNLKEINILNEKHELTTFDITFMTDMTDEERKPYFGFKPVGELDNPNGVCKVVGEPQTKKAPASWDWREKNVVTPIKDQGRCGACWAFSATGVVESRYAAKHGSQVVLSEQQMVDCDEQSNNCNGGWMASALTKVMQQGGQVSSSDYPYEEAFGSCRFNDSKVVAKVTSCTAHVITSEDALKELVYQEGPLAIGVYAGEWCYYNQGIFDKCETICINHGVLLVGYGTENGKDYWIIKNSWGEGFGEKGYIKVPRGVNCIGIANGEPYAVASATVE